MTDLSIRASRASKKEPTCQGDFYVYTTTQELYIVANVEGGYDLIGIQSANRYFGDPDTLAVLECRIATNGNFEKVNTVDISFTY